MKNKFIELKHELEKMKAVEMLEYHDKNFLAGNEKTRSEEKQRQFDYCLMLLNYMNPDKSEKA